MASSTEDTPQDEQRSADQDAALETAFVNGTLPEADRRAPDADALNALSADAPLADVPVAEILAEAPAAPDVVPIPRANVARIHALLDAIAMPEAGFVSQIRTLLPAT